MLEVTEIFHSIQGEGVDIGEFVCFVRLAGCLLHCRWCDTKYSWDKGTMMSFEKLECQIYNVPFDVNKVVFTGGEPGLQAREIELFLVYVEQVNAGCMPKIAFETNGTFAPHNFCNIHDALYTISPKLSSACENGYDIEILRIWRNFASPSSYVHEKFRLNVVFKFVIDSPQDLDEAANILKELDIAPRMSPFMPVVFQPNGLVDDYPLALRELYRWVTELHPELIGFVRILPQLHRIMWGNKRGV